MIQLHNGDCLEVMKTLPDGSVDAVITDPPYGVDYRGRWNSEWAPIANDKRLGWLPEFAKDLVRITKIDGFVVCFYGWPHAGVFLDAFNAAGFRPSSHLVFVKNQMGLGYNTRGKHEQAYLFSKGKPKADLVLPDVLPWTRVVKPVHPTQKPLDAIEPLCERFACRDATVLDPFMGSGTTGVACVRTGRNFIGIELDAGYFAIARSRIEAEQAKTELFAGAAS